MNLEKINKKEEILNEKFKSVIRDNLRSLIGFGPENNSEGVDVSYPRAEDMEAISNNNFEIRNFRTTPRGENSDYPERKNFHFYIGKTEIHLMGEASNAVYEKIAESEKQK